MNAYAIDPYVLENGVPRPRPDEPEYYEKPQAQKDQILFFCNKLGGYFSKERKYCLNTLNKNAVTYVSLDYCYSSINPNGAVDCVVKLGFKKHKIYSYGLDYCSGMFKDPAEKANCVNDGLYEKHYKAEGLKIKKQELAEQAAEDRREEFENKKNAEEDAAAAKLAIEELEKKNAIQLLKEQEIANKLEMAKAQSAKFEAKKLFVKSNLKACEVKLQNYDRDSINDLNNSTKAALKLTPIGDKN